MSEIKVSEFIEEIKELSNSKEAQEKIKEYVTQMNQLGVERYSGSNQALIWLQVRDRDDIDTGKAKYFHGYKTWLNKGRQVEKGADSFKINGPPIEKPVCPECGKSPDYHNDKGCSLHEDSDPDEWDTQNFGTETISVFEYNQTKPVTECDNKTLDDVEADEVWTPQDRDAQAENEPTEVLEKLENMLEEEGIVYVVDKQIGDVRGSSQDGTITVAEELNTASEVQLISHELAHEKLHHDDDYPREQKEVEAETVAFAVCSYFGIETESDQYVASWDSEEVETWKRISDIQNVATEIIDFIEE